MERIRIMLLANNDKVNFLKLDDFMNTSLYKNGFKRMFEDFFHTLKMNLKHHDNELLIVIDPLKKSLEAYALIFNRRGYVKTITMKN